MPSSHPRDVLTRPVDPPDAVLRWAAATSHGDDGLADVYLPETPGPGPSAPLVVALHGGFWTQSYDRRTLRPLAVALRGQGWAVALPEYRRTGGRGGWPATFDDMRALRARLPGLLAELAPDRVSPGPVTLLGHSAGGHLALWWALGDGAARCASTRPPPPARVVALAPVADLARAHTEGLGGGATATLLGGGPEQEPEAYAVADVAARLRAGEPPGCPVVVVHGTEDVQVPAAHNQALAAEVAGVDLRLLPGIEHFGLIDPRSPAWPEVLGALG